ncbi:MAG: hypothetical protein IPO92_05845 [Saprospiraceae bacterium]|nr:hypothetical protein [Saprospiraceae bacterium]
MSPRAHKIYLATLTLIVVITTLYLLYTGSTYYITDMEERFYHPDHARLKPSGLYGHGLGIIGTLLILIGVFGYMARKRYRIFSRIGILKHWLEFHIFLCTLGPILVLFHTSFKFGGIVSISFWSMVAVVASGVIGRFIYLQIPRTIQGQELSLSEINDMKSGLNISIEETLGNKNVDLASLIQSVKNPEDQMKKKGIVAQYIDEFKKKKALKSVLKAHNISNSEISQLVSLVSHEMALTRKIQRLVTMQKLFRYWHIAHLPFALIMLIIMVIHVAVTLAFGYVWVF